MVKNAFILLVLAVLLTACESSRINVNKHSEWQYILPEEDYVVTATGYAPIQTQLGQDKSTKMIKAIKASKLDAYRELTEKVYGHKLTGDTRIADLVLGNESIKTSVRGVIKGARIVKTYQLDGIYVTELELNLRDIYRIGAFTNGQSKAIKARYL
ncbi:hypothetical protein C2869_14270 [Saccharobesus litoralis]|uniref:Lipoprotein LPP20-like domain-containing protein n=2 Tax=Saccharobesus litoralis TaxID=2172099 RepID=A0A2S0VXS5_9ALTE|nr:hypothetical protein C2869_14270 [Saccharobesus litoralis]